MQTRFAYQQCNNCKPPDAFEASHDNNNNNNNLFVIALKFIKIIQIVLKRSVWFHKYVLFNVDKLNDKNTSMWEKYSKTQKHTDKQKNIYMYVKNVVWQEAKADENILQLRIPKVLFEIVSF